MSDIFLKLINLSITASWLILAVLILRFLLKKAPKWISCILWGLVAIRLICPFSLESALSLVPSSQVIPSNITEVPNPAIHSGIPALDKVLNPVISDSFTPDPVASANPLQILLPILTAVWIAGVLIMLIYAFASYLRLKKKVSASVKVHDNIYVCDEINTPFILGLIKPIIYLPSFLNAADLDSVISHETTHINRHDHWWKPMGYLLLAIYWFNPFCWLAYTLLCRDIELACDEKVVCHMNTEDKTAYSQALLNCSIPRRRISACPLSFGEVSVKERVRSVLQYKKPAFWITLLALAVCIVTAICFLTIPKNDTAGPPKNDSAGPSENNSTAAASSYKVSSAIYTAGLFNFFENETNAPQYCIHNGTLLWNVAETGREMLSSWQEIGSLKPVQLRDDNFDRLFIYDGLGSDNQTAAQLRKNTASAEYAETEWNGTKLFFYILQQKNSDLLLCRGFYTDAGEPFIRWVQTLERQYSLSVDPIDRSDESSTDPVMDKDSDEWGLSMDILFLDATRFNIVLKHNAEAMTASGELTTPPSYEIRAIHNGETISFGDYMRNILGKEYNGDHLCWDLFLYSVKPNAETVLKEDLRETYGILPAGEYVLCKPVTLTGSTGESSTKIYMAPFAVVE